MTVRFLLRGASLLLVCWSCTKGPLQPVELVLNEEVCSHCRMAISELSYSGQVVSEDGSVAFFDDLGCLARAIREGRAADTSAVFVADYPAGGWLPAGSAIFVRSSQLPTPMRSGVVAFASEEQARVAAAELQGEVMGWEQVLEKIP